MVYYRPCLPRCTIVRQLIIAVILTCLMLIVANYSNLFFPQLFMPNNNSNNDECVRNAKWTTQVDLILPISADYTGLKELGQLILPSLGLFWPRENLRLLFITDGEAENAPIFADLARKIATIFLSSPNNRTTTTLLYNFAPFPMRAWDRQQWTKFWIDNFTLAEYVGFIDSDAVVVTRVTESDLFINGKPIVRAAYGKPQTSYWERSPPATLKALGLLEPFACMTYFPIIFKTSHFRLIREHIRRHLNATTFDEAFRRFVAKNRIYSEFDIMCTYLWYNNRDDYYWTLGPRTQSGAGPDIFGQITNLSEAGLDKELLFSRQVPHLAVHWKYARYLKKFGFTKAMRTGVCYSMREDDPTRPRYCSSQIFSSSTRNDTINVYEWMFANRSFVTTRSLEAHRERLKRIDTCDHDWDYKLLRELTEY